MEIIYQIFKNSEFLGYAWWGGIGAIATIIFGLWALRTKVKKLGYHVIYADSIFNDEFHVNKDISITYKGREVRCLSFALVSLKNYGNIPILITDFEDPIGVFLEGITEIIEVEVKEKDPTNMKVSHSSSGALVTIEPMLLNPNDSFTIKIIYDGECKNLSTTSRIVDIRKIDNLDQKSIKREYRILWVICTVGALYFFLIEMPTLSKMEASLRLLISFFVLCYVTYIAWIQDHN